MDDKILTFLELDKRDAFVVVEIMMMMMMMMIIIIIIIIIANKRHESMRCVEVELHSQPCTRGM